MFLFKVLMVLLDRILWVIRVSIDLVLFFLSIVVVLIRVL